MRLSHKIIALVCLISLASGCRTSMEGELVRRPSVKKDPCAGRLHDVCGHLLQYYAIHMQLPPTPAALRSSGSLPLPPLVCPASGKPYVYDPNGVHVSNRPGRVVLYDPEPSHWGMRWAILIGPSVGGANITARVILLPEEEFAPASEKRAGVKPGPG